MKRFLFPVALAVISFLPHSVFTQTPAPVKTIENQTLPPNSNPIDNISLEISKISKSLQTFNKRLKELLDQSALARGTQLNERQQKLLLAFEILNRAEERLAVLQRFQIDLAEKESSVRSRLAQIEQDARPESIDRSVAFVGTTKTEELRENRRRAVDAERGNLSSLASQIRANITQTTNELRQAENLVQTLRKKILPQIEIEISDL